MSIRTFFEKVEADLGIFGSLVEAHAGVVLSIEEGLNNALKNPIVDGILTTLLPPAITSHLPQVEAILQKAIDDTMQGTKVIADVQAQTTGEGKVKVLLMDIETMPNLSSPIIHAICVKVLAAIDNNALSEEVYSLYLKAQAILKKKK